MLAHFAFSHRRWCFEMKDRTVETLIAYSLCFAFLAGMILGWAT